MEREIETVVELKGKRIKVRGYVETNGTVEILEQSHKVKPADMAALAEALVAAAGTFDGTSIEDAIAWNADKERAA